MPATSRRYPSLSSHPFPPPSLTHLQTHLTLQKSRQALKRYLHYCNRYMNHLQSMKFENKVCSSSSLPSPDSFWSGGWALQLYARVKSKMEEMQAAAMSWIEVGLWAWVKGKGGGGRAWLGSRCSSSSRPWTRCARAGGRSCTPTFSPTTSSPTTRATFSKYTQPAPYSKKAAVWLDGQENQGDLEQATEQLSEFLERDLENQNLVDLKQKVQDKYRLALLPQSPSSLSRNPWAID